MHEVLDFAVVVGGGVCWVVVGAGALLTVTVGGASLVVTGAGVVAPAELDCEADEAECLCFLAWVRCTRR
jgi:hypothetical protein